MNAEDKYKDIGYKYDNDGNWEFYDKDYETFTVQLLRHLRENKEDNWSVILNDIDNFNIEIKIAENVDSDWIINFDKLLNKK